MKISQTETAETAKQRYTNVGAIIVHGREPRDIRRAHPLQIYVTRSSHEERCLRPQRAAEYASRTTGT